MSDEYEFSISALRKKHRDANGSRQGTNGDGKTRRAANDFRNGAEAEFEEQSEGEFEGSGGWTRPGEAKERSRPRERRAPRELHYPPEADSATQDAGFRLPFDPWRLIAALKRRWMAVIGTSFVLGMLFFAIAFQFLNYKIAVKLWRRETSNAFRTGDPNGQSALPREMSEQTLFQLMRSGEVLRRVSEQSNPHVSADHLSKSLAIVPTQNPDILSVTIAGRGNLKNLVNLANLYASNVVEFTKYIQASESTEVNTFLQKRLVEMDAEVAKAKESLAQFTRDAGVLNYEKDVENNIAKLAAVDSKLRQAEIDRETVDYKIKALQGVLDQQTPANDKLDAANEELANLQLQYTAAHPLVIAQRAKIAQIEKQSSNAPTGKAPEFKAPGTVLGNGIYLQILDLGTQRGAGQKLVDALASEKEAVSRMVGKLTSKTAEYGLLKARVQALEITRAALADRQRQVELWVTDALGYYRLFADATLNDINNRGRWIKVFLIGWAGALLGLLGAGSVVMIAEALDTRLKTAADVTRITGLPVLATLRDLTQMDPSAQVNWAFRTLTLLQGKLNETSDQALVCGIVSSTHGEGRSTWVNLLVSAASQRGLRVLTVDTRPTAAAPKANSSVPNDPVVTTLTPSVLATPAAITTQLTESRAQPVVHIPLPGWVWNLERRKQWQSALAQWRRIDNLVLLVELPPASQPESLLLAENLPQILWLVGSGMPDAAETKTQLETFRHARCNIVGAALNRAPAPIVRHRVARWFTKASCLALVAGSALYAAEENALPSPIPVPPHSSFSASKPAKRADWQKRLTLGPGDSVDISLFGYPDLTRTNIFVGPDGRFSYLQLQDFPVTGLTIDDLRARLDQELSKYYTTGARTIVTPVAFQSKKYYMLGKIAAKGVYTLDRPLTIIEAVARAKGLETGLYERTTVELADLSRAALIRKGVRQPVDFEKLFLEGDLSQNVPIEPGDYLYFPGAAANEIFVLGEIMNPGPLGFTPSATMVAALTDRGGFTPRAFQKRVLVIRGSMNQPETFAVDAAAILTARAPDFKLEPKDIVYVSSRPWIKIEELLDDATQSFIEAAVTTWGGAYIGPLITQPIIPHP